MFSAITSKTQLLGRFSDICSMQILIVAATSFEIQASIDFFGSQNKNLGKHEITFLVSGVGMVTTTYALTKSISRRKPDIIMQAGIAGCFEKNKLVETVVVSEDRFADLGVTEDDQFKNIFDLRLADKNEFPFSNGVLVNPHQSLLNLTSLQKTAGITVNEITTSKNKMDERKQNRALVVESMEGAAFHYVCLLEKIPFLQIRSISNDISERDKTKWKLKESIAVLNEKIIFLIEEILKKDESYFRV